MSPEDWGLWETEMNPTRVKLITNQVELEQHTHQECEDCEYYYDSNGVARRWCRRA